MNFCDPTLQALLPVQELRKQCLNQLALKQESKHV